MHVALRSAGFACVWFLVACDDPGCLRHSQCANGLECRDALCQLPLAHDAGPGRDAQAAPTLDAAVETPLQASDAAVGGEATPQLSDAGEGT